MEETAQQIVDRKMIARVARGDQSAFGELYDRLSGPLYSLAMKMLGDAAEAQDALQEACFTDLAARRVLRCDAKQCLQLGRASHAR